MNLKSVWTLGLGPTELELIQKILGNDFKIVDFPNAQSYCTSVLKTCKFTEESPKLLFSSLHVEEASIFKLFQSGFTPPCPFFVISDCLEPELIDMAFEFHAIDFLTTPLNFYLFQCKIKRALNEAKPLISSGSLSSSGSLPSSGSLTFCALNSLVTTADSRSTQLTSKEFKIAFVLAEARPQGISRESLYMKVWGDIKVERKTLDVHIFNLRRKLESIGHEILYKLDGSYTLVEITQPSLEAVHKTEPSTKASEELRGIF